MAAGTDRKPDAQTDGEGRNMTEITLHTGEMGSCFTINLDWSDHNNIKRSDRLEIRVRNLDKPRTLRILLNDVTIGEIESNR